MALAHGEIWIGDRNGAIYELNHDWDFQIRSGTDRFSAL
jgi:hypothetical protein